MSLILTIILWILLGTITSYFARQRGRDPLIWFVVGMSLGLIGLVLLFILPPAIEEDKTTEVPLQSDSPDTIEIPPSTVTVQPEYALHDWFYIDREHQQKGPIPFIDLKKLWSEQQITLQTFVWMEGMESWKKIEELADLQHGLVS